MKQLEDEQRKLFDKDDEIMNLNDKLTESLEINETITEKNDKIKELEEQLEKSQKDLKDAEAKTVEKVKYWAGVCGEYEEECEKVKETNTDWEAKYEALEIDINNNYRRSSEFD